MEYIRETLGLEYRTLAVLRSDIADIGVSLCGS